MKDITLSPETATRLAEAEDSSLYDCAHALFSLRKYAGLPVKTHALRGRLYLSSSGWLMLQIPNAIGQGAFDALHEPGAELPLNDNGRYNAHCSVMRPEEIEQIGGADKITERGHSVAYSLGPVKTVEPDGWKDVSRVWYIQILSPEIQAIRRSYGLTSLPNDDKYDLHATFAIRRRTVLHTGPVTKLSEEKEARPYTSRFTGDPNGIELPVPVAVLGGSTLAGSLLASDTGSPAADITRGAVKGLSTGGGALGGFMLANHLLPEEGPLGQSVGAGLGGLAGWLAANKLSKLLGLERKGGVGPLARQEDSEAKGVMSDLAGKKQAASESLASLIQAKRESDRKNYPAKHHILRNLLQQARDEFAVGEAVDGISSVVHKPTNFQMHAPEKVMGVAR